MEQESANEFFSGYCHRFLLVAVLVIAPFKGDLTVLQLQDPAVGNRNAVRISAQILDDTVRIFEGGFAVNHPFFTIQE